MIDNEDFRRRVHAYVTIGAPLAGVLVIVLSAWVAGFAFRLGAGGLLELPVLVGCVLIAISGLMVRRYLPRQVAGVCAIVGLFVPVIGWLWSLFWFLDWHRVNRMERVGMRQALVGAFAWPFSRFERIAKRARTLDIEGLVIAHNLADHTILARERVYQELRSRGEGHRLTQDWLPPPRRATVPPNIYRYVSAEAYQRAGARRETFLNIVRVLSLLVIATAPLAYFALDSLSRLSQLPLFSAGIAAVIVAPVSGFAYLLLVLYVGYVAIVFSIGALFFSNLAGRVLLLRPFGQKRMAASLKNVVRWYMVPFGHVITLSDSNYKPNPLFDFFLRAFDYLLFILGPLLRPSFRLASVKTEHTYFQLAYALTKKYRLSLLGLASGGQAFNVRSTDSWWKPCINLLMNSSDIVVMDISRISTGSSWEIARLSSTGLINSCIFIVEESHQREGLDGLRRHLPTDMQPRVYVFRETGEMLEPAAFEASLREAFERSLATWGRSWTARPAHLSSVVPPAQASPKGHERPLGERNWDDRDPSPMAPVGAGHRIELMPLTQGNSIYVARSRLESSAGVIVGRSMDCDIVLTDPSVSKRHAALSINGNGQVLVNDLGSRNGTWKGGTRVQHAEFSSGEVIGFGGVQFRIVIPDRAARVVGPIEHAVQDYKQFAEGDHRSPQQRGPQLASPMPESSNKGWLLSGFDAKGKRIRFTVRLPVGAEAASWIVGRIPERADHIIADFSVSDAHAQLRLSRRRGLEVCDLGSGNGTRVDGAPILGEYVSLQKARKVAFGTVEMTISRA